MPSEKQKFSAILKKLPKRLWKLISRNWGWKLFSLVLAVCLWAGLISQDETLTRERLFTDVQPTISGADTLRRNSGLIVVSGLEEDDLNVRFRVNVPQKQYNTVTASNYNPRIDLTRITDTGEQTLKVLTTSSTTYGSVSSVSPETITVVVDEYITNYRIPVTINALGDYPAGLWGSTPSCTISYAAVSGPKTVVDQIASIQADCNLSALPQRTGEVRLALPFRYVDAEGNELSSTQLEASSVDVVLRTLTVNVTLYQKQNMNINLSSLFSGSPAKGYAVTGVTVSPEELTVYGPESTLALVHELYADNPLDITGRDEDLIDTVRIAKPTDGLNLLTSTATVQVKIEPILITKAYTNLKLNVKGLKDSLTATLSTKTATLDVTGPQLTLQSLKSGDITAYVDLSDITEPGSYSLPVQFYLKDQSSEEITGLFTPSEVTVTVAIP